MPKIPRDGEGIHVPLAYFPFIEFRDTDGSPEAVEAARWDLWLRATALFGVSGHHAIWEAERDDGTVRIVHMARRMTEEELDSASDSDLEPMPGFGDDRHLFN